MNFTAPDLPLLLLEDDPAIAETVRFALSREGWLVEHVTLLGDARERLLGQPFAAAVLDVGLPDGSGLELLRWIRAEGGRARVTAGTREITAPVAISAEMMPGVVSLPHGWGHDAPGARLQLAA